MTDSPRGLYETLITEALAARLTGLDGRMVANRRRLHDDEAADRIALQLSGVLERAIRTLDTPDRVAVGIALARKLIDQIVESTEATSLLGERPHSSGEVLRSILGRLPDGRTETVSEPLIPLLDTTLLTNAPQEPHVGGQILQEILSADRIDVVMAFVRRTGIAPMLDALRSHCTSGRGLRVLTTTYTGSTEARALDMLTAVGADVRVSYDLSTTRLHAKAWLLHRASGFSTAYIGSSNLTHSAQVSGLEWNVRVSEARNASVIGKVAAVFESYWNSGDFEDYDAAQFLERTTVAVGTHERFELSPIELHLRPFQEQLLERLTLARLSGRHRNLLAAATGTGKTVMAAVDYTRLQRTLPRARLLFVAHRKELLTQARATFRHALRDPAFGELWVDGAHPRHFTHVFASIQSLSSATLDNLDPDRFDVVIVDEFHHAAAASYQRLLDHVAPVELLGLTATPERSDGQSVLGWFDGRIAAELRLWDAIDAQYLAPFHYFGVHDGLDLRDVPWRRGRGYDVDGLSKLYTGNDLWARRVLKQVDDHVGDLRTMRALGFCVSVDHARFMARQFNMANVPAVAIWSETADDERARALSDLRSGAVQVVFSVDLFNEGVDVPMVDTVLMLRPTESPTLFMQQLGRGLRKHDGKTTCTVLDFVGLHRTEFRFDRRFRALLGGSRNEVIKHVEGGFPYLPAGCHMALDSVARDIVLASIKRAVPSGWTARIDELRRLARSHPDVTLGVYLDETGLDLDEVYAGNHSWSELRELAGLPVAPAGPNEVALRRACGRLLHVDDVGRIDTYRRWLASDQPPHADALREPERRRLRMLVAAMADQVVTKATPLDEGAAALWAHTQVRAELMELLDVLATRVAHVAHPLTVRDNVPLAIHGRYSRIEILAAFGVGAAAKVTSWQQGVLWVEGEQSDLLAFTLDKTTGHFSPTTRYRDYAISRELIHWESQSATREDSETGRRYQEHAQRRTAIMLFARRSADDRAFYFLGPARYVRHESELPMAVTWRLDHSLPGDLFTAFAAAVA